MQIGYRVSLTTREHFIFMHLYIVLDGEDVIPDPGLFIGGIVSLRGLPSPSPEEIQDLQSLAERVVERLHNEFIEEIKDEEDPQDPHLFMSKIRANFRGKKSKDKEESKETSFILEDDKVFH